MSDLNAFAQTNTASRLRAAAARGALSHALIFSGAGDRVTAARYAAAAMECTSAGNQPCLACPNCRKVAEDIHPDVIYVRDPDHKELSAEVIRAMRSDVFIRPNEGARKVYLFEDCSAFNEKGQNILLKTVEEGPPYAAFLFCAENSAALLQTVRSRCVEIKLGDGDSASGAASEQRERAAELCRLCVEGSAAARAAFLFRLENAKCKREELGAIFEEARRIAANALLSSYGAAAPPEDRKTVSLLASRLSKPRIARLLDLLEQYRLSCTYNVGVGLALGGFAAEWEELMRVAAP